MTRTLTTDPSGDGTAAYFFVDEKGEIEFTERKSSIFAEQLDCLNDLVRTKRPTNIIYENIQYIDKSYIGKETTALFQLFGAIENLQSAFNFVKVIDKVPTNQVKLLRKRVYENKEQIPSLIYKIGKGWFYQEQKISVHQLDAFLVYYLWKKKFT